MDFFSLLEKLGFNRTRLNWKRMQWEQRWQEWRHGAQVNCGHVMYQHKFCDACGALLDRKEKKCPHCGVSAPSWFADAARRLFGLVLPAHGPLTFLILGANLIIMAFAMSLFGWTQLVKPTGAMLIGMGALVPPLFHEGEFWRIITYGYLHIGIVHILFNMMALSQVGTVLEREIGGPRYFVVYTLTLIGGGLADVLLRGSVSIIIAGASGALFGLIGFGALFGHCYGGPSGKMQRDFFLKWALYGFVFGFMVGADNWAHAGGFITGAALGVLVERERRMHTDFRRLWRSGAWICLCLTLAAYAWMVVDALELFQDKLLP